MLNGFRGSSDYVASDDLMNSVNVAMALKKPLLVKGEPGTGKTKLAEAIADSLEWSLSSGASSPPRRLRTVFTSMIQFSGFMTASSAKEM